MSRWLRPVVLEVNRWKQLERTYRIMKIRDHGFDRIGELSDAGHSVLLAPNHSDHSDPHVVMEVASRYGMHPYFMGAREIFEVSALNRWGLQTSGVFSVDRDGPDLSALKTAISLLEAGESPLVMFPEGEIYHHHRRIDPLNEGVASILLKAAGRVKSPKKAYLVPVALRFFHDPSVESTWSDRVSRLEDRIGWVPKPKWPIDERIIRLAMGVLALKETEFLGEAGHGEIRDRLSQLCDRLLQGVESRYPKDANATTPPERVRALRFRIRRRLLDAEHPPTTEEKEALLDDLDRIFSAFQAHSYIGDYLLPDPTLNRRSEMIMKLEEDLLGFPCYPVKRSATITAGEPICVNDLLEKGVLPAKGGAPMLTQMLEMQLTEMLRAVED
jgi:1-acyl-sn-glycerol-3-phosphate acyltransferase